MSPETTGHTGFGMRPGQRAHGRRSHLIVELIATVALVLSIMVAMTAVSMGIARSDAPALAAIATRTDG